jgi:2-keto-3-deoxy-L-rhamnonate aldolase RhmA
MTRVGTVLSLPDPVLAELACRALDFAWIDLEHGALSARDAQVLALAVQATGADAYVRVPSSRAELLTAILDAGVDGIVVPRVESAEEAAALARRLDYPPAGSRGFGPRRAGGFGRIPGYASSSAARVRCLLQIESEAGLAAAPEIAAAPGIDALVLGCADLAFELGVPGRLDAPELVIAAERVADAAEHAGIGFGVAGSGDPEGLAALAAGRAESVVLGADVRLYAGGVDGPVERLRDALEAVRATA